MIGKFRQSLSNLLVIWQQLCVNILLYCSLNTVNIISLFICL